MIIHNHNFHDIACTILTLYMNTMKMQVFYLMANLEKIYLLFHQFFLLKNNNHKISQF